MKIELEERELEIVLDALDERIASLSEIPELAAANPMIADQIAALEELSFDLFESLHRDDDFGTDAAPDAALGFIQAGIDAREEVKASSRAAERRNERMMKGTATPTDSDTWPLNDPVDW